MKYHAYAHVKFPITDTHVYISPVMLLFLRETGIHHLWLSNLTTECYDYLYGLSLQMVTAGNGRDAVNLKSTLTFFELDIQCMNMKVTRYEKYAHASKNIANQASLKAQHKSNLTNTTQTTYRNCYNMHWLNLCKFLILINDSNLSVNKYSRNL